MTDLYSVLPATLARFEQHDRLLRLHFPHEDGPTARLLPEALEATEGLSRDFRFVVTVLSDDATISPQTVIGKMVCVDLVRTDGGLRHFNGYVFEFARIGTDGGLATYRMVLGPWLAFLKLRQDNYLFHDKTIGDQTAEIFKDYPLADYEMRIEGVDDPLTLATQWQESDYNYLHRRWEDRGWHYGYEHRPDGHTLFLCDDSLRASGAEPDTHIRYHDGQNAEDGDAIGEWSPMHRLASTSYSHSSFDFKNPRPRLATLHTLNDQGDIPSLEVYEYAGAYGFKDADHGDALARLRIEEIESQAQQFQAAGDCARLQPGHWFELVDHYQYRGRAPEDRQFLVVEVSHHVHNNYLQQGQPALYRNQATCVARHTPWRLGRGANSATPKLYGLLTATVVGPEHEEVFCDEYGRVRVQFHFDREGQFDQKSSCWIRVASNWAGDRFGLMALPRIGQEVLVQFLDGNPDKPLITGRVYNQDHMPPWELNDQQLLTGIKSKEIAGVGFNHLILDDTPERIQAQLATTQQSSQLNLGHITRIPEDAGQKEFRGEGFELRTDAWGAIRAGRGLHLTTYERLRAEGHHKAMGEVHEQLELAQERHARLTEVAQANGMLSQEDDPLAAVHAVEQQNQAIRGGERDQAELSAPHLVMSSPAGITSSTRGSTHVSSEQHTALTSGGDLSIASGQGVFASMATAFKVFVQRLGIKLVAAGGDIEAQALTGAIKLLSKFKITAQSARIELTATDDIYLNGGGSYVRINAAGIECGTPGTFHVRALGMPITGPTVQPVSLALDAQVTELPGDASSSFLNSD